MPESTYILQFLIEYISSLALSLSLFLRLSINCHIHYCSLHNGDMLTINKQIEGCKKRVSKIKQPFVYFNPLLFFFKFKQTNKRIELFI